ncbi:MAG: hypothetical protein HG454_005465 [Clostridiales bacterium]|nr:hypothetical protein [Clostridiales bacterium]
MFKKWFKENNENIYILREDLDILKSNKDLNILNLYLNLNKENNEFGIEELLKDMILIKENIIKEYDKDRSFEIKIINQNQSKDDNIEISEDVLKENWDNILKYITIGEPLFYQMIKNSIPFNVNKIDKAEEIEDSNEYNIIIAFANNPVLYLKNKNFEMLLKNLLQEIYNSKINISIELNRNDIEILREKKLKEEEQYENDKKEISRNYILQNTLNRENREKEKEQEEEKSQEKTNIINNMSANAENNKKQSVVKSNGSSNVSISSNTIEKKTGTDKEKKHIFGRMPYGKEVPVVKVKGIHENLGDIIIVGEIIDKEIREIREDLSLASYAVYDGTSSIMVKKFLKKEEIEDVEKRIKEHMSQNGLFKIYGKPRI